MTDLPRYPGTPLWVKVQAIPLIVLVLIIIGMVASSLLGQGHGLVRHGGPLHGGTEDARR